jgi:hypothetical protein
MTDSAAAKRRRRFCRMEVHAVINCRNKVRHYTKSGSPEVDATHAFMISVARSLPASRIDLDGLIFVVTCNLVANEFL